MIGGGSGGQQTATGGWLAAGGSGRELAAGGSSRNLYNQHVHVHHNPEYPVVLNRVWHPTDASQLMKRLSRWSSTFFVKSDWSEVASIVGQPMQLK